MEVEEKIERLSQNRAPIPEPDDLIKVKSIQTVGHAEQKERVEKWELDVYSVNEIAAKQRARSYVRRKVPNARNILNPVDEEESEQSTLIDFFTESLNLEFRTVSVLVVKPPL